MNREFYLCFRKNSPLYALTYSISSNISSTVEVDTEEGVWLREPHRSASHRSPFALRIPWAHREKGIL